MAKIVNRKSFYVEYKDTWGPGKHAVFASLAKSPKADRNIAEDMGMKATTVGARRVELWRDGYIRQVDMIRDAGCRQRAIVWELTNKGIKKAKRLGLYESISG